MAGRGWTFCEQFWVCLADHSLTRTYALKFITLQCSTNHCFGRAASVVDNAPSRFRRVFNSISHLADGRIHAFQHTGCPDGKRQSQIAFNAYSSTCMEQEHWQALPLRDDIEQWRNQDLISAGEGTEP